MQVFWTDRFMISSYRDHLMLRATRGWQSLRCARSQFPINRNCFNQIFHLEIFLVRCLSSYPMRGSPEKFSSWPRYSHGMWLNEFYFSTMNFSVYPHIYIYIYIYEHICVLSTFIRMYIYIYIPAHWPSW